MMHDTHPSGWGDSQRRRKRRPRTLLPTMAPVLPTNMGQTSMGQGQDDEEEGNRRSSCHPIAARQHASVQSAPPSVPPVHRLQVHCGNREMVVVAVAGAIKTFTTHEALTTHVAHARILTTMAPLVQPYMALAVEEATAGTGMTWRTSQPVKCSKRSRRVNCSKLLPNWMPWIKRCRHTSATTPPGKGGSRPAVKTEPPPIILLTSMALAVSKSAAKGTPKQGSMLPVKVVTVLQSLRATCR